MRNIVIIGGSSTLGLELIKLFSNTDQVIYTYNTRQITKMDFVNPVEGYKLDVTNEQNVKSFFEIISEKYHSIDVLINTSGIYKDSKIEDMSYNSWQSVIDVNLTGVFLTCRGAIPLLKKSQSGKIINIGSVVGEIGGIGAGNYAASKSGLFGLTKTIAREVAKYDITANVISLGYLDGGMGHSIPKEVRDKVIKQIPLRKFGNIEDISHVIYSLSLDYSNYITGQIININGGLDM